MRKLLTIVGIFALPAAASAAEVCVQEGPQRRCENTELARTIAPGEFHEASVGCPDGTFAVSGGFSVSQSPQRYAIVRSEPLPGGIRWIVKAMNHSTASAASELTAFAICR